MYVGLVWHSHTATAHCALYITRISGRFAPFILVGSPLRLGPPALGMDRVEQPPQTPKWLFSPQRKKNQKSFYIFFKGPSEGFSPYDLIQKTSTFFVCFWGLGGFWVLLVFFGFLGFWFWGFRLFSKWNYSATTQCINKSEGSSA